MFLLHCRNNSGNRISDRCQRKTKKLLLRVGMHLLLMGLLTRSQTVFSLNKKCNMNLNRMTLVQNAFLFITGYELPFVMTTYLERTLKIKFDVLKSKPKFCS